MLQHLPVAHGNWHRFGHHPAQTVGVGRVSPRVLRLAPGGLRCLGQSGRVGLFQVQRGQTVVRRQTIRQYGTASDLLQQQVSREVSSSSLCYHFGIKSFFASFEIMKKNCFVSLFMMTYTILDRIT